MDKRELRQYRQMLRKIEQLKQEQEDLLQLVKPSDGQPKGKGVGDPVGNSGAKLADLSAEIDRLIQRLTERRYHVEKTLSRLSEREYNLMHSYYILGHTWEQVAEEMGYNLRWVYRLHGKILQKLK
ncbi:MAG: sigma factor-like helix-turn-helix DNA-binding protein [Bacillota bacterium]|nr:sigma factor-like helix-turn-helix DNA-binding protein [Bacillota bacterium]